MKKHLVFILLIFVLLLTVGCKEKTIDKDYISIINNAKEIVVKKSHVSIGKEYHIYVDDEKVAEINGKMMKKFGDTFTLTDMNGIDLIKEKEIKNPKTKIKRMAKIEDMQGNILGYFGEKLTTKFGTIGSTIHFFDENQIEIGKSDQENFSFSKKYKIYNVINDNIDYEIVKKNGKNQYTITINDSSNIPVLYVIFNICVENAVEN